MIVFAFLEVSLSKHKILGWDYWDPGIIGYLQFSDLPRLDSDQWWNYPTSARHVDDIM